MTQPTPYNRQFNFANYQTLNPTLPLPGTQVDAELNAVKLTSDETLANLAKIQRDDGALKNGIVTKDSLAPSLSIGFTMRGEWAAPVNYLVNDGVTYDNRFYRAKVSHLSVVGETPDEETDLWEEVADFTELLEDTQAAADAAAASAAAASSSASSASGSAAGAATSETNAATSETNAADSAADAAASALEAANVVGDATDAVRWDVEQSLSQPEKQQARDNIGVAGFFLADFDAFGDPDDEIDETVQIQAAYDHVSAAGGGNLYCGNGARIYIVDGLKPKTGVNLIGGATDNGGIAAGQFASKPSTVFKLKASSSTGHIFKSPIRTFQRTSAGTVAVTNGSPTVTGTGTAFTGLPASAGAFYIAGVPYTVDSIASDTSLTLKQNYAGTTGSGKAYSADTLTITEEPSQSFSFQRITFDGNGANNSAGIGIDTAIGDPASTVNQGQDDNVTIRDCAFHSFKTQALRIQNGHRSWRIADTWIADNDGDGVWVNQTSDIIFQNLYIGGNGGHNYRISGCASVAILGGSCWSAGRLTDATKNGVKIEDSDFYTVIPGAGMQPSEVIVVTPVVIDRCGGAGVDVAGSSKGVRITAAFILNSLGSIGAHGHINANSTTDLGVAVIGCSFGDPGGVSHAIKATGGFVLEAANQGATVNDLTKMYNTSTGVFRVNGNPVINSDGSHTSLLTPQNAPAIQAGGSGDPANYYRNGTHKFLDGSGSSGQIEIGRFWDSGHLVMGGFHFWIDGGNRFRGKIGAPASDGDGVIIASL